MSDVFTSMLSPWQWFLLGIVPPAIVALYFLKLRRQPLEVPSTYLWRRTIEDMHVNSLWQRLRQNLLMFLQLLLIALLMLACLRPSFRGQIALRNRLIFLVDVSASMSATDVDQADTRLDFAKKKVDDLIEQMAPGDAAMLISFADRVMEIQPFTTSKRLLRDRLQRLKATQRTSAIDEALKAAAGLANPGRSSGGKARDTASAAALPADVFILSDGGFRSKPDFSWGNLNPVYVPIGKPGSSNVALTAFSAEVNSNQPDKMQAFAEIENFSAAERKVRLSLELNGVLLDAATATVPAGDTGGVSFAFDKVPEGTLSVAIDEPDMLDVDNRAFSAINAPRQARLLLVTDGNDALEQALATRSLQRLAEVSVIAVDGMQDQAFEDATLQGDYDLILFDRCQPEKSPACNALYIGSVPPGGEWKQDEQDALGPQVIDVESMHPLMKYVNFGDVRFVRCRPCEGPPGTRILVESEQGPMISVAPRQGFEDVVMAFPIMANDEEGNSIPNTDWPIRYSFPLFFKNVVQYLGGVGAHVETQNVLPGEVVPVRIDGRANHVTIISPSGNKFRIARDRTGAYLFADTDEVGIYQVTRDDGEHEKNFAVNLFDPIESRIVPREFLETEYTQVQAEERFEPARRDAWRWILAIAVLVLVAEWYVYNRRVYL